MKKTNSSANSAKEVKRFEVGNVYECRSACDHDCIFSWRVTARTEKFITVEDLTLGTTKRVGVSIMETGTHDDNGQYYTYLAEYAHPNGHYSMAPVICADAPKEQPAEQEAASVDTTDNAPRYRDAEKSPNPATAEASATTDGEQAEEAEEVPYWQTPEYAREKATTMLAQIVMGVEGCGGIGWDGFNSWGASKRLAMFYDQKPTLALRVSGLVHQGWVLVSLNEGSDVYEIHVKGATIDTPDVKTFTEVYCDELGAKLDNLIEWPEGMSKEDYHRAAMADSAKKWAAGV